MSQIAWLKSETHCHRTCSIVDWQCCNIACHAATLHGIHAIRLAMHVQLRIQRPAQSHRPRVNALVSALTQKVIAAGRLRDLVALRRRVQEVVNRDQQGYSALGMSAGLLQASRVPVRLCGPACHRLALPSVRLLAGPTASPVKSFTSAYKPHTQLININNRHLQTVRASSVADMTARYAHELQAACEAVRLAARLCTVLLCNTQHSVIWSLSAQCCFMLCRKCSCS